MQIVDVDVPRERDEAVVREDVRTVPLAFLQLLADDARDGVDAVAEQLLEVRQLLLAGLVDVVPVVGDASVAPAHLVVFVPSRRHWRR